MDTRNRNILLIVLGAVLLVCCCAALVAAALGLALIPTWTRVTSTEPPAAVIGVTDVAPLPTATRLAQSSTLTPAPRPASPVPGQPTAGAATRPAPAPSGTPAATSRPLATSSANNDLLLAQAALPARDLRALAIELKPDIGDVPATVNPTPPSYKVGDKLTFWVSNQDTQEHRQISATLRYMTAHVYMWVQDGVNYNDADLKKSADRFESETYPTDREFFGSEWTPGVDNDVHLHLLHATNMGRSLAGAYSSADEYSHLVNPYSNEKEMFYIAADRGKPAPGTSLYDGVLAHEFQHMIHWNNDRNEDSWVNEGMSELASHLNGFDVGGFDYAYAARPDTQLNTWSDPSTDSGDVTSAHYGGSYLFMNYFLDRFGEELTKAVVANKEHGIAGFNDSLQKAGRSERFDDIFADWVVANFLDLPDAAPKGRFGYADIDPMPPTVAQSYQRFPASGRATVSQYGADYIELRPQGDLTIDFTGAITVPVVSGSVRGAHSWWSNRGDDSDATLTRAVDLSQATKATLTFSAWYDLEENYDFVYVEVSTDGGKHWQILKGQRTSDKNPTGNAFGPGWTGNSGGGKTPQWINEQVDLSTYAGKQIQLRFQYITDDAVNRQGLLLDNIAIPEINFQDDGERGPAGWQADGWALIDNTLSERWLVQLVASDGQNVQVQRMQVGPDGHGQLTLAGAGQYSTVMLVVSAQAPVTTQAGSYRYTISTN